jgi:hypothetical protein
MSGPSSGYTLSPPDNAMLTESPLHHENGVGPLDMSRRRWHTVIFTPIRQLLLELDGLPEDIQEREGL